MTSSIKIQLIAGFLALTGTYARADFASDFVQTQKTVNDSTVSIADRRQAVFVLSQEADSDEAADQVAQLNFRLEDSWLQQTYDGIKKDLEDIVKSASNNASRARANAALKRLILAEEKFSALRDGDASFVSVQSYNPTPGYGDLESSVNFNKKAAISATRADFIQETFQPVLEVLRQNN